MSKEENRINSLAVTFLERQQIVPNPLADQIISAYKEGYHQAEKDLELTWEEIYSILYFEREVLREFGNEEHSNEEVCKEVLKRFKETKIPNEIII